MATNFGPEVTQAPEIQSFTTVKRGVVREPTFLQGLGDVFDQASGVLKARKAQQQEGAVAEFVRQQVLVADALEQGAPGMTPAAAKARHRKNFLQALEANPGLASELISAQKAVIGTAGLAQVVDEGTKEQQRLEARADQLVTAGLLPASHTEQDFQAADEAARVAVAAEERHTERMRTLEARQKQLSVDSAEYEANQREIAAENRRYFQDTQPVRFQQVRSRFEDIISGAGSAADKQRAIEDFYTAQLSAASAQLGTLTAQETKFLIMPFEQMRDQYIARANGTLEDAEMERNITRIQQAAQYQLLQDPQLANAVAATKMFGEPALVGAMLQNTGVFNKVSEFIAGNSEGATTPAPSLYSENNTDKKAAKTYLDNVTSNVTSTDEELRSEADSHLSKILESLVDDEGKIRRNPKAAFQPVKWISSSEFLKARQERPELFEAEMDSLRDVLGAHYADEVWGMVRREFETSEVVTPGEVESFTVGIMGGVSEVRGDPTVTPTPDAVAYRTTPSGMEFYALDPENTQAVGKARQLNANLKPIINETIRAQAHIDGRSDYGAYWDQVSDIFMQAGRTATAGAGDTQVEGGESEDDLNLQDFQSQVNVGALPEAVAQDTEFLGEVERLSNKYELDPSILLGVMDFETGGSFDPAQANAAGSSATGLIQFMASTAKSLGTSTDDLKKMSRVEQMQFVEQYLDQFEKKIRGGSAADVYMAVLFPKAINKEESYALFTEGTKAYRQNKGLDTNKDGKVTKAEAARKVNQRVKKHATR